MTPLQLAIHVFIALSLPPLLLGIINKTKAGFAGRVGPPFLQPYFDLRRLLQKGSVFSTTTTWVFRAGPIVALATSLLAVLLMPMGDHVAPISFAGDVIFFAYLFGLARFFTIAAALDTGSSFEGMGGAREATFSSLAEPALFFGLLVLAKRTGSPSLSTMLGAAMPTQWTTASASMVLVAVSLFIVVLAENSRIPFDDPNTHLELTMIHEVMVLDHSGPLFGIILYASSLKLFLLGTIVVRVAIPLNTGTEWGDWGLFVGGMMLLAVGIGVVESFMARLKLVHVPSLLIAACLLSAFGVVLLVR